MTIPDRRAVVLVTGLSGAGKHSVLRVLEDLGHETVDNPPLAMLPEMVARGDRPLAIGVDARTRGFDAVTVLDTIAALRAMPSVRVALVYCWADETVLMRRYAETRRRHPLAPDGRVTDGICDEQLLTALLREHADLVIDTSNLPMPAMRRLVEQHFGTASEGSFPRMALTLVSFAYPAGLPRDADLVFDARFLRNPHYDPILQPRTGLDPEVGAYVEADPDFQLFFDAICSLLNLALPRFVQEGKKYVTIAIGCTGGRHRSVHLVERLHSYLARRLHDTAGSECWLMTVLHRELTRAHRIPDGTALPFAASGNLPQER